MPATLEILRSYTTSPNDSAPPELRPWDNKDPWGLEPAARAALGLLLAGEAPGSRLFAVADYLLTFYTVGYGDLLDGDWSWPNRARILNGTALALCGYLCEGAHPEAELWRLSGCARLATGLHREKAARGYRLGVDCLRAVCETAQERALPILADLLTLQERIWGTLVDHSRAERLEVSESAYPSHMNEPIEPGKLGGMLADREWERWPDTRGAGPGFDTTEADGICENLITFHAHMHVRHQFGSDLDWHLRLFDDVESTVSLAAQPFLHGLAAAYGATGAEKYARHAARLLWSFYRQCPVPNYRQSTGPWRSLEAGNRQANNWPAVMGRLARTDAFDSATLAMLARSRFDHMRYLLAFTPHPSNWYQVEAAGLATATLYSPELRQAEAYLRVAMRRLKWMNSIAYHSDGMQFELSLSYHAFPTGSMGAALRVARARQVSLPAHFVATLEKAQEMYLYIPQPDGLLPTVNDSSPRRTRAAPYLRGASNLFARPDFLWGATEGREGRAPDHTSHAWPASGYYVMRDRWAADGQYLFFDAGPYGAGHQHEDKLNFILHAHGRALITDPGIYSYSQTELTRYFRSARGHNTVMIDGMGQARRHRRESNLASEGRTEWVCTENFDFVSGEYVEGFGAPDCKADAVDMRFSQRRAIFFVKPGYWILCDLVRGPDVEPHKLEQIFHIAPIFEPDAAVRMRAGAVGVSPAAIMTEDEGLANLAILPVDPDGLEPRAQKGELSPCVGWHGVLGEFPAWDVTLERQAPLPARLDAVLFPMPAGSVARPTVRRLLANDTVTAFRIEGAGLDDTFILCEEGAGEVVVEDVRFEGRALLLRRAPGLQALAVEPLTVTVAGKPVTLTAGKGT